MNSGALIAGLPRERAGEATRFCVLAPDFADLRAPAVLGALADRNEARIPMGLVMCIRRAESIAKHRDHLK
jgi:hypothetical protein